MRRHAPIWRKHTHTALSIQSTSSESSSGSKKPGAWYTREHYPLIHERALSIDTRESIINWYTREHYQHNVLWLLRDEKPYLTSWKKVGEEDVHCSRLFSGLAKYLTWLQVTVAIDEGGHFIGHNDLVSSTSAATFCWNTATYVAEFKVPALGLELLTIERLIPDIFRTIRFFCRQVLKNHSSKSMRKFSSWFYPKYSIHYTKLRSSPL